jgi:hypothetical protein
MIIGSQEKRIKSLEDQSDKLRTDIDYTNSKINTYKAFSK